VAVSGGASASFQYDPFGRRVSKTIGGTTQFLYDGANPVQELSGTTASANLLTGGVDEYFQRTDAAAGARNFLTDALGSTVALADSAGTVQTSYTFEPFGNTTVTGAATTNSFSYTGRELDATGLYFYRARYYNQSIGRFISEDPIGFAGGINLYGYAGQNPISLKDSSGLQSTNDLIANAITWGRKLHNRLNNLARCADSTSQVGSINSVASAVTGTDVNIPLLGGNSVGELESVLVGPEPGTDPTTGTNERIQQGINVAADIGLHAAVVAAPHIVIGTFTSLSMPVSYASGVYSPIAVAETSATLGGTAVGGALEFFSGLLELKLAYDAEIYVLSYGVCLYTHSW